MAVDFGTGELGVVWGRMGEHVLLFCIVALSVGLGWLCGDIYDSIRLTRAVEMPLSGRGAGFLPSDRVDPSRIHVFKDRVVIDVKDVEWAEYEDTGSMEPVLGAGANGLQLNPKSEGDVRVGDIVAYEPSGSDRMVVHRVVGIRSDDEGTYYVLKGDNAALADPGRVRFSQIRYVLIGVIY